MNFIQMKTFNSIMFFSLLWSGIGFAPFVANASSRIESNNLLSRHQRVDKTFECGGKFTVSIEENASGYSYTAVNVRGDDLVIDGGTSHTGRNYAIIYVFSYEGTEYILEDYGTKKADLSIATYPQKPVTYRCVE